MKKIILTLGIALSTLSCSDRTESMINETEFNKSGGASLTERRNPIAVVATFEFTYGRQSKNCHGFGVCQLTVLGIGIVDLPPKPENKRATIYKDADLGDYYAVHLLDAPLSLEDTTLYIDNDLKGTDENNQSYLIKAGEYKLDNSYGKFGGYEINIVKL